MPSRARHYLGPRQWGPLALWTFREFNELPHVFERRLSASYAPAEAYMRHFSRPLVTALARCVSFVAGALVAVLLLLTLFDESIELKSRSGTSGPKELVMCWGGRWSE